MTKHKILFISSWFPNKLEPTNGNFVQRHAEAVSLKHDVEILHTIGDFNQDKIYLIDEKIINEIRTVIVYYKNSKNPLLNFARRMNAYKKGFSKMQFPDLVHCNVLHNNMLFAVYLKKKFKIPYVVTEHWTALRKINENKTSTIIKRTAAFIGNQAEFVLPVSKDLLLGLKNLGIKCNLKVIPNVVDTELFSPQINTDSAFTFIHISNLIPRKNADKILKVAINLLKEGYDFKLQIGGDGDFSELKKIVEKENLNHIIDVFGIQTLPQVAKRMHDSDCFILFSNDENQPCVIAEAFASGLKVISTNVGGISEFFPKDFGILLEKAEENLLKEAMMKILGSDKNYNRSLLKTYAENIFSKEKISEEFSKVYEEVLKTQS